MLCETSSCVFAVLAVLPNLLPNSSLLSAAVEKVLPPRRAGGHSPAPARKDFTLDVFYVSHRTTADEIYPSPLSLFPKHAVSL